MLGFAIGSFLTMHGLVHVFYALHARRRVELRSGMTWPDGAALLGRWFAAPVIRRIAATGLGLVAAAFAVTGVAAFLQRPWWPSAAVASAVASALVFIACWDGTREAPHEQGVVGVVIDAAIVFAIAFGGS